ncbi:hypothetical protein SCP_1502110 [Sparassis crispa]|uniref:Uncharacterized protein n=1 Tax=Sparassis crispa TaxID=139825 RepID=A0A401H473_9APHY|nr:hypothetical protein SCP_1502110 [Sparassis crispa]GBE89203.1 hypothetical protein SCP_1502110 [Sparassis crispa]
MLTRSRSPPCSSSAPPSSRTHEEQNLKLTLLNMSPAARYAAKATMVHVPRLLRLPSTFAWLY